ncbi:hypothetical protein [Komarekiella delphini-convector]|uniref:hypothetical protein n=1 Tax=Komarekiella delphini-convector TaxID=3050158 RepID=UPI00177E6830|nr:hypothetical protein [Komarekiella delphini-convector]
MKFSRQLIIISSVSVVFVGTTIPAVGQTVPSFLTQFQQIYQSLQRHVEAYKEEFTQAWGELGEELTKDINSTVGDLGIPDPLDAGKKIKVTISKKDTDLLETNPSAQGNAAVIDWNEQYSRGQAQSILGAEGQRVQAQESEISNDAAVTSLDNAQAAQADVITQDILKKMAVQNLQSAVITKSIHAESQKQSRALATANINLADISSSANEQARKQEAESNATAREIIRSAGAIDAFWEDQ